MPLSSERIEKWSLSYHVLKHYIDFAFHTYYKVTVKGIEKIDFSKPLIFAPNHQNALIDALAVLCVRKWQPVFLARSDVFKGRFLTRILTFLKILPVYRIRDGYSTLLQNNATFSKTLRVFENRNGLVILPEGSHQALKTLRPLKKGIARITFQAEEAFDFKLGICIVPVGLEFENYHRPGSELLITFGEPIAVEKFIPLYLQNQPQALNELVAEISQGMKREMIHISDLQHHDSILTFLGLSAYFSSGSKKSDIYGKFKKKQSAAYALAELAGKDPAAYTDFISELQALTGLLGRHGLNSRHFQWMHPSLLISLLSSLALIITLPLFLLSWANTSIPAGLSYLAGKGARDPHFISSFRFVAGLLSFPMLFLVQAIILSIYIGFGPTMLMYMLFCPLSVWVTLRWQHEFLKVANWCKLIWLRVAKPAYYHSIIQRAGKLLQTLIVS